MRNKRIRKLLPISIVLAITMILGLAGHAFAAPPTHTDKVEVLVSFTEKPSHAEKTLIENEGGKVKRNFHIVPTIAASIPKGKLDSLRRNPKVTSVEEDITVQITNDKLYWSANHIDAEAMPGQNQGQGVKVAILDTGIDLDHPDLRMAGNVSFVPGTASGDDDHGHGTMVAGVVAALDNDTGVVGVAPEVALYSVKVLDQSGNGTMSVILSGIEWAVDNNMQVINMSFGGILNWPSAVRLALQKAYQAEIVIVAGAGNTGDQGIIFAPARFEPVIAVGATDSTNARASFSGTGSTLELMAPGVGITSTSRGGGYSSGSGTSLSTPHVAGVAALLIADGVTHNVEVRQILQTTAKDLGSPGWDSWYGYGLVSVAEAIAAASSSPDASGDTDSSNEPGDTIPPTTRIELSGLPGNEGWYRSDVMVELAAVDNTGGSGVAETQYSLDGGKTWQNYHEPFALSSEGTNTIQARSRDNAGNIEVLPVSREVNIDQTGPSVNILVDSSIIWPANRKQVMVTVRVTGSSNDLLSRVSSTEIAVKDEYGQVEPIIGPYLQGKVWLEAWREGRDLDGRVYTISITATDYAGNVAIAETTVTVPHDRGKDKTNKEETNQETLETADNTEDEITEAANGNTVEEVTEAAGDSIEEETSGATDDSTEEEIPEAADGTGEETPEAADGNRKGK